MNNWKNWLKAAGIRAVKTMAQTAVALIPVAVTINAVAWPAVLGSAARAGGRSGGPRGAGLPEVEA